MATFTLDGKGGLKHMGFKIIMEYIQQIFKEEMWENEVELF